MALEETITISTMFEIIRRALAPFYAGEHVIIQESPMEGEGDTKRTTISELDFIQRAIAETYVERWGDSKDLEKALADQDDVTHPKEDLSYGLVRFKFKNT